MKAKPLFASLLMLVVSLACSLTQTTVNVNVNALNTESVAPQQTIAPSSAQRICVVNASTLNLRENAGTGYAVKDILREGAQVAVLTVDAKSGWLQIQTQNGKTGWINPAFCGGKP